MINKIGKVIMRSSIIKSQKSMSNFLDKTNFIKGK